MREPVPGTVPIGGLKEDAAFFTGKGADGQFVATIPVTVDEALLERGRQRYVIYCQPCHDARGDGKGILFQRGNVPTASFHQEKILKYPDGQIFDVITNGKGLMPGYRWPIPPADRWAIVAYVRELERKRLASAAGAPASAKLRRTSPRPSEGGTVTNGVMNGVMNRKLLFLLGPVAGLVMFAAVVWMASSLMSREYREPYRAPAATVDATPRAAGTGRRGGRRGDQGPGRSPTRRSSTGPFPSSGAAWPSGRSRSSTCCSRRSSLPFRSSRSSSRRSATRPEICDTTGSRTSSRSSSPSPSRSPRPSERS